ncbi:hypothetical protein PQQ52_31140 [Paraburkholderia sediminicola]|uniref:hypothetical protein n=1 Tax=Paraburkholderia sediminicola TaxID=458836 RepID=UPI0038BBE53F
MSTFVEGFGFCLFRLGLFFLFAYGVGLCFGLFACAARADARFIEPTTAFLHSCFIRHFAEAKPMAPTMYKRNLCFLTDPSGEHVVRGGKHDSLVTNVECARARIPDAPLPLLRGGPA